MAKMAGVSSVYSSGSQQGAWDDRKTAERLKAAEPPYAEQNAVPDTPATLHRRAREDALAALGETQEAQWAAAKADPRTRALVRKMRANTPLEMADYGWLRVLTPILTHASEDEVDQMEQAQVVTTFRNALLPE